ncbi:hypothetical protein BST81_20150 [Leptolyngbya sp. 'hensonii']|uniref:hypothetical protein n=1 Tax=Leptolyngbya sp. 'hensonii' TaxID=1922337 RepID=UPI00094FE21D|nr:hypothetical protein [Leptolyngbya sp. 'hensonii']OLP16515.1 hypothetical protein BST81_20150 [Leptolyngbya sp. 'hensonii']
MRILITIAHYYQSVSDTSFGSLGTDPQPRITALTQCLSALYQLFGYPQGEFNYIQPGISPANEFQSYEMDIVICTTQDRHLLYHLPLAADLFMHHETQAEPLLLGFECQAILQDCLGLYDYYCFLEDDILLHDPWFFIKLDWFTQQFGPLKLLQPNRYEASLRVLLRKAYIDGPLPLSATEQFQNPQAEAELLSEVLGRSIGFHRCLNPHAGCYFLNAEQMEHWADQPYFLDRDVRFQGPLESAATLGIMRTFQVYKPAAACGNFLEVQHFGAGYLRFVEGEKGD